MKIFFPYELLNARKGEIRVPTSYLQDSPSSVILALRVAQVKEAKGFFSNELHTRSRTWKPLNSARAGLSPQEGDVRRRKEVDQGRWSVSARREREKVQEKKETKEGEKVAPRRKGSVCPQPRISFLVHEYLGSERPVSFEVSAPTRLCL